MENTVNYLPQGRSLSAGPFPLSAGGVRFAQIAFSLPGRRSARLRPSRGVVTPLVLRLLFLARNGQDPEERGKGGQGEMDNNTRERMIKRGTLERWKWISVCSKESERS